VFITDCTLFDDVTVTVKDNGTSLDSSESLPSESMSPLSAISPRVIPLSYPTRKQGEEGGGDKGEEEGRRRRDAVWCKVVCNIVCLGERNRL
jgi:hypothetical protein